MRQDDIRGIDVRRNDFLDFNRYPMAGEMVRNVRTWNFIAFDSIADDDDLNDFSPLEKRHGIADCAGGAAAAIPTYQDTIELDAGLLYVRHNKQRTPGVEQGCFDDQRIMRVLASADSTRQCIGI
jgi:hypothetical protein